jgi:hypothetical protein
MRQNHAAGEKLCKIACNNDPLKGAFRIQF